MWRRKVSCLCCVNCQDHVDNMDHIFRHRRIKLPKRYSELVALMAISTTLFLFIHTRDLHTKLREMQDRRQSDELISSNQLSGHSGDAAMNAMVRMLTESGEMDSLDAQNLNNTAKAGVQIVFFNRVPKVGSQTFMELLRRLSIRNQFGFHRDHIQKVETIRLAPPDQIGLAEHVNSFEPPAVYIKHVCFTNFTEYHMPEPIYVNLVRDPVERVISWYYYVRAPWYYVERKQAFPDIPLPDPRWLKMDFETCVLEGNRECRYIEGETHEGIGDHRRQSLFFCGHGDECTPFNTVGAMQRAKDAVERHYAVVGVLEDLNSTLTVMEHYVPRFFAGAGQVYREEVDRFARINRNLYKPPVSEAVKDIVRRNFTREIEFYEFVRQRLHRQLLALKLPAVGTR